MLEILLNKCYNKIINGNYLRGNIYEPYLLGIT